MKVIVSLLFVLLTINSCFSNETAFIKLGTYNEKEFFVPRFFKVTWIEALNLCNTFGMSLATLETANEFEYVRDLLMQNSNLITEYTHIGGMTTRGGSAARSDWHWIDTDRAVSYSMNWYPGEPNNNENNEYCLSLQNTGYKIRFNDMDCNKYSRVEKFLCQKKSSFNYRDNANIY